ncbi:MAG: hypothetical protein IPO21_04895 [Bacteroidales bacterium]|nr:hypothetical protein [Bacteroidales bacterium]
MFKLIATVCFAFLSLVCYCQIVIKYQNGEKANYAIDDVVTLSIVIKVPPETCIDGMNQTKLYQSGISIIEQLEWQELKKGLWQKKVILKITGNKKDFATLTIMRRNDKQSISQQIRFNYTKK